MINKQEFSLRWSTSAPRVANPVEKRALEFTIVDRVEAKICGYTSADYIIIE